MASGLSVSRSLPDSEKLSPNFASLCNDILELWMHSSSGSEALMDKLSMCVDAWAEGARRGQYGNLKVQEMKNIFLVLFNVVHTLQKLPDMEHNTRLRYVVEFISDLRTELDMRTVTMTNPKSVFSYVKSVMTKYAPPYVPPALHVETVAEEGEEEEETAHGDYGLFVDIEAKMKSVSDELKRSGTNKECLACVRRARVTWPGDVKFFTQDARQEIAAILGEAQETLNTAAGTPIWVQLQAIIELLVPPIVSGDAVPGGDVNDMPLGADVSTLLRQMKQLCA